MLAVRLKILKAKFKLKSYNNEIDDRDVFKMLPEEQIAMDMYANFVIWFRGM